MMRPQLACFIFGRASRVVWNAEVRLIAMIASQRSTGKISTGATCWMPALLTRMSMRPKAPSAARIICSISAGLLMSAPWYSVFTPRFCNCASTARIASGSPKPLTTMLAPWAASASAMASPIPLVDPVTRAVFPFSMQTSFCGGRVCHCRADYNAPPSAM